MNSVIVLIGSGAIGVAIARRVSVGKRILLADFKKDNLVSLRRDVLCIVIR